MLTALREYMGTASPAEGGEAKKRNGSVVYLFDVVKAQDNTMVETVEELVVPFGVTVQRDRVFIAAKPNNPLNVLVSGAPQAPISAAKSLRVLEMRDTRSVQTASTPGGPFRAEAALVALAEDGQYGLFTDTNLAADPVALVQALRRGDREAFLNRISRTDIPVAAAVSEQVPNPDDPTPGRMMAHPRVVVFGDSTWVSNRQMREGSGWDTVAAQVFAGSLAWLRQRPEPGVDDPKERKVFLIDSLEKESVYWAMVWLPVLFICLGIVGLGASVWAMRRR
jgi:hypothetical protein